MAGKPPTPRAKPGGVKAVLADPARLRAWLANPGLRSKLPESALNAQQRQGRWAATPVTTGSSLTNGQLAGAAKGAAQVRYGGQISDAEQGVTQAQRNEVNVGSWYDNYLRELGRHQQNISQSGVAQDAQMQAYQGGIRNIDTGDAQHIAQQNQRLAAQTGASQLADPTSNDASIVRQGMLAGYGALLHAQAKNASDYSSLLAHVVGPQQKAAAQVAAQDKTTGARAGLSTVKGQADAYKQDYKANAIAGEDKTAAAVAIAGGKNATAKYIAQKGADARKAAARSSAGATRDAAKIRADAQAGKVNQYGYADAQWAAKTDAERVAIVRGFKNAGAKPKADKPGTRSRDPQVRFEAGYSALSATSVGRDATGHLIPITPAFARANGNTLVNSLRAKHPELSLRLAQRIVSAYIQNGGKPPGSFKNYGHPRKPGVRGGSPAVGGK